jgi:hypothetical protein
MSVIVGKLYDQIKVAFQVNAPLERSKQALNVLRFLSLWKGLENVRYSRWDTTIGLCETILDSALDDDLKWDAARLAMQVGFRHRASNFGVLNKSATVCVTFLEHHLTHEPQNHDSIADAFQALILYHNEPKFYSDRIYDFSEGNFIRGICSALEDPGRERLHRLALRFVHHIAHVIGDPTNVVTQQIFIKHGFSTALKAGWESVMLTNDREFPHRYTFIYLEILERLANSRIWHPYILDDHWDTFEYAGSHHLYWLRSLLRGDYARKTFGCQALAEYVRVAWRTCLRPITLFEFNPELVLSTVNLLVMRGKPATRELAKVVEDTLRAVEAEQNSIRTEPAAMDLVVLKELVKFFDDVEMHMPNGWRDVVIAKARRRRDAMRMRWR